MLAELESIETCLPILPESVLESVEIRLLRALATGEQISMDTATLINNARCYVQLDKATRDAIRIEFLKQIVQNGIGGGTTVNFAIYSGDYGGIEPPFTPDKSVAIAFDTSTGTQWNWWGGAWH